MELANLKIHRKGQTTYQVRLSNNLRSNNVRIRSNSFLHAPPSAPRPPPMNLIEEE